MFFSAYRRAVRERREIEADRDFWKARALASEEKLEKRSDFFIEREFAMVDRFLTSQVKTYAITDQIRAQQGRREIDDKDAYEAALEAHLKEQEEVYTQYAEEAGKPDPRGEAKRTVEAMMPSLLANFERDYHHLHQEN